MFFLYRHIRLDKNVPFYIGIGREYSHHANPYKRAYVTAKRNPIWNNIVSKTKYDVEILFETENEEEIKIKESEFIRMYGRIDLKSGTLSNMSDGGDGAFNMSFITRNKISRLMKGNKRGLGSKQSDYAKKMISERLKGNTYWKGNKHKEESKKKIGLSKKNKPLSEAHRKALFGSKITCKKVYCINNGVIYASIGECIRELFKCNLLAKENKYRNYKHQISRVCNNKKDNYKGYKFKFV